MSKRASAPLSSTDRDKLDCLRSQLDDLCSNIAAKFNLYDSKGRPRKAFILNTLMKYSCIGCIIRSFTEQYENKADIDAIYKENHKLAVNMLTQHLQYCLHEEGFNVLVQNEVEDDYGRIDVLVKPTGYGVLLKFQTREILVEVKTGKGLSYDQLVRYLIDRPYATIVIWRVSMNQILLVKQETTIQLLFTYLEITIRRATILLSGNENQPCSHNNMEGRPYIIENPQKIMDDFLVGLRAVSRVCDLILHVLSTGQ